MFKVTDTHYAKNLAAGSESTKDGEAGGNSEYSRKIIKSIQLIGEFESVYKAGKQDHCFASAGAWSD